MGLLLSVLITCVGVLEVIACYTHFRIGTAYNDCKSNLRDVAKYYAVELRKHELHFEPGPDDTGPSTSQDTLSELMRKRTVRTQEKSQCYSNGYELKTNGHILNATSSSSQTPDHGTPNLAANLKVPRNSVSGLDSPTVQKLISPELDITEAVEKIQNLESNEWIRKSPSPYPDRSGLEIVDKEFWKSRSSSPFPDSGVELIYTPGLKQTVEDVPPLLETPDIPEVVDKDFWNKPPIFTQSSVDSCSTYSRTDLEVQNITESMQYNNEALFGITADTAENEDTKFDEAFLRSLDGMNKSSKCDDRRRSFRKKRNSSSTSSRASRDDISRSITSLDEIEPIDKIENKKISPLTEEDTDISMETSEDVNGHQIRTEIVTPEKCESIASPTPKDNDEANVTKQEQTLFEAKVAPNVNQQESSNAGKGKANLNFTEKVKDLEISVQLLVTVKGTSQGDKMEYTTTVSQDDQKPKPQKALDVTGDVKEESITKTTEDKSEFGNVKTSITYGSSVQQDTPKLEPNLKDLQISSQSLIHAERTVQDDVISSEAEFLKLYESFTELPERQKDQFLKIIGKSKTSTEDEIENIENISQNDPVIKNTEISTKISEEIIEVLKKPDTTPKEKIEITEITEITESTESVITIPPEKSVIEEKLTLDATISQISTSDNETDNKVRTITTTQKCDQGVIEKQTNQVEIIEAQLTQNKETVSDEKQIATVNNETELVNRRIIAENQQQSDISKEILSTEAKTIINETQIIDEPKIEETNTTVTTEEPTVIQEIITTKIVTNTKQEQPKNELKQIIPQNTNTIVEESNTVIHTETQIPKETVVKKIVETSTAIETQVQKHTEAELPEETEKTQKELTKIVEEATETKLPEEAKKTQKETTKIVEDTLETQVKKQDITGQNVTIQKQEIQPIEETKNSEPETKLSEETEETQKKTTKIVEEASRLETQVTKQDITRQQVTIQTQEIQLIEETKNSETETKLPEETEETQKKTTKIVEEASRLETQVTKQDITRQQVTIQTQEIQLIEETKNSETETKLPEETEETQKKTTKIVEEALSLETQVTKQDTTGQKVTIQKQEIQPIEETTNSETKTKLPEETEETQKETTKIVEEAPRLETQVKKQETIGQQITIQKQEVQPIEVPKTSETKTKVPEESEKTQKQTIKIVEDAPKLETQVTKQDTTGQQITIQKQEVQPIEVPKTSETSSEPPKNESSSESSSTPSTAIETPMRRASAIVFEDATPVQNQEMLTRRVSNSEISPKQASQAFWEPDPPDTPQEAGGPAQNTH